jgi:FkbM family methyltransferase
MSILTSIRYHLGLVRAFGLPAAASLAVRRRFGLRKPMKLRWRRDSVIVRPRESDPVVASSIFGWDEYGIGDLAEKALSRLAARWRAKGGTPVIVDGGANVGYAALHFARKFPDATIIAVEPNLETFRVLEMNCAGHSNIRPVFGALWSHSDGVALETRPDLSWADSVRDGGNTPSFRLQDLMRTIPGGMPLIIKLDIEGAENEVCRASPELLRQSACLLIEPHDYLNPGSSCLSPLYDALNGQSVDTLLVGEYIALIASDLLTEKAEPVSRPKVSAAIVSYNRPTLLRRAIDSVLAQTLPAHEIIVVDNCSPDFDVFEALASYGEAVRIVRNTGNNGCGDARNVAVRIATGDFIAFLDDDDFWKPGKLERQIEAIGSSLMVTCGQEFIPNTGYNVRKIKQVTRDMLRMHNPVCGPSTYLCRRDLFDHVEFDTSLKYAEDWDFMIRVLEISEIAYVPEALIYYTVENSGRSMTSAGRSRSWEEIQYRFAAADKHRQSMGEWNYRVRCASITLNHFLHRRDKMRFVRHAVRKAGVFATSKALLNKLTSRFAR